MDLLTSVWSQSTDPWRTCRRADHAGCRIQYVHRKFEDSGLPKSSVDMLLFQYVVHECPQSAIRDLVTEAARTVRRGGILAFIDTDPMSKTIQGLPPALATLVRSTSSLHISIA